MLETKRLLLRPWRESDAQECFRYASDPDVGPIAGWPPHTNIDTSRLIIKEVLSVPETYAIVLKETDLPIGCIAWGQGIMPEASEEILRHGFEDLGMRKIWCGYYDGNNQSRRVQEKLGFTHQWTRKNVDVPLMHEKRTGHVNCMTREEWKGRK